MNPDFTDWYGKPYYSLNAYCRNTFGQKLYKASLNAGLFCPNRDGTLGRRGCIFCSAGGSGDFAYSVLDEAGKLSPDSFETAYRKSLSALSFKGTGQMFIVYFQAYTNTYGPVSYLDTLFRLALSQPSAAGISIATRPDALPEPVVELLIRLKKEYPSKFIWIELGLQTIHESSADFIRRGYPLSCFEERVKRLSQADIPVIVHVILGLPGESREDMLATVRYLNRQPLQGIKLQLLYILKGTDLGRLWERDPAAAGSFSTMESYLDTVIASLELLRPDLVVHRLTGDAPRSLLLAPSWSTDKKRVLNTLHRQMAEKQTWQGMLYHG